MLIENIISQYRTGLAALSKAHILYMQEAGKRSQAEFAVEIRGILLKASNVLAYAAFLQKEDLIDCLKIHYPEYIKSLSKDKDSGEIEAFTRNYDELLNKLQNEEMLAEDEQNQKLIPLGSEFASYARKLYAEKYYATNLVDKLQTDVIAYNIPNISFIAQGTIAHKLYLAKEAIELDKESLGFDSEGKARDSFIKRFHSDPINALEALEIEGEEDGFEKIICLFVDDHDSLIKLSDNKLIALYDRLKNLDPLPNDFFILLYKVSKEAKLRYSCARLSETAYHLLSKFQHFDSMNSHIEDTTFSLIEKFIFSPQKILQDIIKFLNKNMDNIRVSGANKNVVVTLNKIKIGGIPLYKNNDPLNIEFNSLTAKLQDAVIDQNILKRYEDMDKFQLCYVKVQYEELFDNFQSLFNKEVRSNKFIQTVIINRLTHGYYMSNMQNSVEKLRLIEKEKDEVRNMLSKVAFFEVLYNVVSHKFTDLSFTKHSKTTEHRTPNNYVDHLMRNFIANCNADQMRMLYETLPDKTTGSFERLIINLLYKEVTSRTSIKGLLYLIFTGKKYEYDKLITIKKSINILQNIWNSAASI